MAYRYEQNLETQRSELVIDGWEKGIAVSPYQGIANIRNLNTYYYPGVSYVNYSRLATTVTGGTLKKPLYSAVSPVGLIYILDSDGQIFKQSAVNSSSFALLGNGTGRIGTGNGGLAFWNNYLFVFGDELIEICGDGTGDAGVISTNWNITAGTAIRSQIFTWVAGGGATDPNYLKLTNAGVQYPLTLKVGDPVTFTTTGTLPAGLALATTYYVTSVYPIGNSADGYFLVSKSFADTSVVLTLPLSGGATSATLANPWGGTTGSYDIVFDNGDIRQSTLTNGIAAFSWTGGLSSSAGQFIGVAVRPTSAGTGVHTVNDTSIPVPYGNCTSFQFTNPAGIYLGATVFNISSYIDPTGKTVSGAWQGASGQYNIVDPAGNNILAVFTNGSTIVTLLSPISSATYASGFKIQLLNPNATTYKTWVSKVDGNLYFANGRTVGRILSENLNSTFNPANTDSFIVDYAVTELLQPNDSVVDMVDLKSSLILAGNRDIYVWDYVSTNPQAPAPVGEQISSITNILNNIYVLAGQKGNIYLSNGYSAQLLFKMPDFIAGIIDPVWSWGGIMFHRTRLFFQAMATSASGTKIMSGIFSLSVSSSALQQDGASGLIMENQNSFGLVPTTAISTGILIDNEPSANGNDSYYSAWGSGAAGTGGIDYNNTTLWSSNEPLIESDLIPIGTFLQPKTFQNMEFKLDQPLQTGDSITVYARQSLSDTYILLGTTTSNQLSDVFTPIGLDRWQWVQFKITLNTGGNATTSSFVRLREIRIR